MIKDFYTLRGIAEQTQIKEKTVRQFVSCGGLKAKVGGKWIVTAESLKKFFNANTKPVQYKDTDSGGRHL